MYRWLPLFLVFFFTFAGDAASDAGPIRYEQIPAEVTGYIHIDFSRLVDSSIWKAAVRPKDQKGFITALGSKCDVTAYTVPAKGADAIVLVWHIPDAAIRQRIESRISTGGPTTLPSGLNTGAIDDLEFTKLRFTYHAHEVYYAKIGLSRLLSTDPSPFNASNPPPTLPHAPSSAPASAAIPSGQLFLEQALGVQNAQVWQMIAGPLYIAFVQPDVMIEATDLPYMARALDVLDGKQPSLAARDPLGMKLQQSPGMMIAAAGINNAPINNGTTLKPVYMTHVSFGVDKKSLRFEAVLTMSDADSADQLKDMLVGSKMIGGAAQPDAKQLLEPMNVVAPADPPIPHGERKDVLIDWSWPTEKSPQLVDLVRRLITQMNQSPAKLPGGGQGQQHGFGAAP